MRLLPPPLQAHHLPHLLLLRHTATPTTNAIRFAYSLSLKKDPTPLISILNSPGHGFTPCNYTFNPAWILPSAGTNGTTGMLLRAAQCPDDFGGQDDHILMVKCKPDGSSCDDVLSAVLPLESFAEDPRVVYDEYTGYYWLWYFASPPGTPHGSQNTVFQRRSKTPFVPESWETVGSTERLGWRRNGCAFPIKKGSESERYIIVGEAPNPGLPAIALWRSSDEFQTFEKVNSTYLPVSNTMKQPEIVIEASTPVVELSTGDFLHLYSAGTPGWIANGNYTAGWVVIDKDDPNNIIQRSEEHLLVASLPFEGVEPLHGYPVQRYRTTFVTSIVPTGNVDEFRLYWGAADANVAAGVLKVVSSKIIEK
jgi:predicted GH43/DUF377 family glycosyl hydrolase